MKNIITPDGFNPDTHITSPGHALHVCETTKTEKKKKLKHISDDLAKLVDVSTYDKEVEVDHVSCTCGEVFETEEEGEKHLKRVMFREKGRLMRKNIRDNFEGVKMYGFEFGGFEGHGSSIFFQHEELALRLYATPNYEDDGVINFQLSPIQPSSEDSPLVGIEGQVVEEIEADEVLTTAEYLQTVRNWIEENLLNRKFKKNL